MYQCVHPPQKPRNPSIKANTQCTPPQVALMGKSTITHSSSMVYGNVCFQYASLIPRPHSQTITSLIPRLLPASFPGYHQSHSQAMATPSLSLQYASKKVLGRGVAGKD